MLSGTPVTGVVSGSLHGWLWRVAAFCANVVGTCLRPLSGLDAGCAKAGGC